jgi:hypothetical protein
VYRWDEVFQRIGRFLLKANANYFLEPSVPAGRESEEVKQLAKEVHDRLIEVLYVLKVLVTNMLALVIGR